MANVIERGMENPITTVRRNWLRRRLFLLGICSLAVCAVLAWRPISILMDVNRSRQLLRHRQAEQAFAILQSAALRDPTHGEVQFLLARCHRRLGRMKEAREHLTRASLLSISSKAIAREEWLALAQSGQMREAYPHLSELLIDPGEDGPEICEAYVNGFFLTTRFRDAFELLTVWEKDFPQDSQPYLFRGRYFQGHT